MPTYKIHYGDRETLPTHIEARAKELGITPEELIHRLICDGMRDYLDNGAPPELGHSLEDYLVRNGVLKPK
ncbi:hypothetical protein [Modicisalibacter sp. MOD 31.J]|uniref:hypothetical protein n=1 Tax=Modicisalibacter sp. MOD 31.J TaxID=2831897 RepID=UPI001CCBCFCF|nr:hypothetical protein [Modicisalibacter sp. MOD 31.J]MBZ9574526.1 hypothetical protein [Modicisalibacter sp. MOD 31.J]